MFEGYFLDRLPHGKVVYVKNLAANKDEPMEEKDEVWGNYSRVLFPSQQSVNFLPSGYYVQVNANRRTQSYSLSTEIGNWSPFVALVGLPFLILSCLVKPTLSLGTTAESRSSRRKDLCQNRLSLQHVCFQLLVPINRARNWPTKLECFILPNYLDFSISALW